jgi:hypothetical protein
MHPGAHPISIRQFRLLELERSPDRWDGHEIAAGAPPRRRGLSSLATAGCSPPRGTPIHWPRAEALSSPSDKLGSAAALASWRMTLRNPRQFFDEFVIPTVEEWKLDPLRVRKAVIAISHEGHGSRAARHMTIQTFRSRTPRAEKWVGRPAANRRR